MYDKQTNAMTPEEELVDVLLDFVIVAATLAKKVSRAAKEKQLKEGGLCDGKVQRTGCRGHQPAIRGCGD